MFHKKQVLILENKEFLFDNISEKAPFYLFLTYCFSEWDLYIVVYPIYFYVMSSNIDIILADINVFDNLTIFVMSYQKSKYFLNWEWRDFVTSFIMLWGHYRNAD